MSDHKFEMDQDGMLDLYRSDPFALRQAIEREARRARSEAAHVFFAAIGAACSRCFTHLRGRIAHRRARFPIIDAP